MVRLPGPADDARLSYIQIVVRPGQRKRPGVLMTPGLQRASPGRVGVTVAKGRRPVGSACCRPLPEEASSYPRGLRCRVPSCPLLRRPAAGICPTAARRRCCGHLLDQSTRWKVHPPSGIFWGGSRPQSGRPTRRGCKVGPGEAVYLGEALAALWRSPERRIRRRILRKATDFDADST